MADKEDQEDELTALASIYDNSVLTLSQDGEEPGGQFVACFPLPHPFYIQIDPHREKQEDEANLNKVTQDLTEVKFLPPVTLNFGLPPDYPSVHPPQFTLSCKWLTRHQLSRLCHKLDELWEENSGCVILFMWTNFLQSEAYDFLDLSSPLDLSNVVCLRRTSKSDNVLAPRTNPSEDTPSSSDPRGIQDIASQQLLLPAIRDFSHQEQLRQFQKSVYSCKVCFMEKLGSLCIQFSQCDHVYCKDCMKDYFVIQIGEGNVAALTCPEDQCQSQAHPAQVKELVSPELFTRYDQLLLKTSLETMTDVVYCPRPVCQFPVIMDRESNMASCPSCHYVFCVLCKLVFHGLSPCKIKSDELKKLREEYQAADEMGKKFLEKKYGKRTIEQALEETWSSEWLEQYAKQCPSCGTHIQKIDGCNKMTCTKCRCYFCWLCNHTLSRTNPYSHFNMSNNSCFNRLFEGMGPMDGDFFDFEEEEDFLNLI
ncbi:E3 ubiquitin-protein ligase RNF14-like [Haliotis cracherodii]|uniref:E3 ubiquitin-protein ligase RNF14-like n=1 Tax=Haliotis cracherodii TaxID=6455 RepID=UPI0039E9EE67